MFMISGSLLSVAGAEGLFEYGRVDFFNNLDPHEKVSQITSQEKPEIIVDEWAEPIISPSGKVSIYVPPKEVKDFLDKPNPGNAKAYLEWNLRRIKKLILAQELLAKEVKKIGFRRMLWLTLTRSAVIVLLITPGLRGIAYFILC